MTSSLWRRQASHHDETGLRIIASRPRRHHHQLVVSSCSAFVGVVKLGGRGHVLCGHSYALWARSSSGGDWRDHSRSGRGHALCGRIHAVWAWSGGLVGVVMVVVGVVNVGRHHHQLAVSDSPAARQSLISSQHSCSTNRRQSPNTFCTNVQFSQPTSA